MDSILEQLTGGDRRSIGHSPEVVVAVLADPSLFPTLVSGLFGVDALVRMRAADAVEKITADHPHWLPPFKDELLALAGTSDQQEVRWHMAQILPRLPLTSSERRAVLDQMDRYQADPSGIVRTFAMQAMADLAEQDPDLKPRVCARLVELTETGSPAVRSRGRKLLKRMKWCPN